MKTLRYSRENIDFSTEVRKAVRNYFKKNNIQQDGNTAILIKAAVMLLIYLGPLALMISGVVTAVPLVLVCWVTMGFGMAGLGMATMHDANHGSFSKKRWVNNLFGKSLFLLGGYPPNWKYQHNTLHHTYTNIEGHDEDIAHGGILRFSPHKPLKKVHKFQYIYAWFLYGLMTISWITAKEFKQLFRYNKMGATLAGNKSSKRMLTELIVSKLFYYVVFLVLPLIFIPVAWYWIVLGFLAMHFLSGVILGAVFQTAHVVPSSEYPMPDEHNQLQNNWAAHQLYTTSNFAPKSRIFSWFIGGLNYQVEHHLFPNISHIHYKHIAKIVQETARKHNLPYYVSSTFFQALGEHTKMLKSLGMTQKTSLQM